MGYNLRNRSFVKLLDFSPREIKFLLDLSRDLKRAKYGGYEQQHLQRQEHRHHLREDLDPDAGLVRGRRLRPGRARHVPRPEGSQIGHKESMKDTARVLGRILRRDRVPRVRPGDRRGAGEVRRASRSGTA